MRILPGIVVASWLGVMACFAFLVAPAAFANLEREVAGRFVSVVFPRYYLAGTVLGIAALGSCLGRAMLRGWRGGDWLSVGLASVMLALTVYAWAVVLPSAHAARETMHGLGPDSLEALRFGRLHRLSTLLNGTVMIAGIAFLVTEVARRP